MQNKVQQLFQHSFGLMTLPVLDPSIYGHFNGPIGNDLLNDQFYDACDQYQKFSINNTNQLTNNSNHRRNNFKSIVNSKEFKKLLKRRYSENVISKSNLPSNSYRLNGYTNGYHDPSIPQFSKKIF